MPWVTDPDCTVGPCRSVRRFATRNRVFERIFQSGNDIIWPTHEHNERDVLRFNESELDVQ